MDSVTHSSLTPNKTRLTRSFAKLLHVRAVGPHADVPKRPKSMKKDRLKIDEEAKVVREAFMAKLFASLSSIKASYAYLQYSQSPYDADGIQSADKLIVSDLKKLSEFKQSYLKKEIHDPSPQKALLLAEIKEHNSLVKTYEITTKKLDSQLKLKESEILFLKEKLAEINGDCKLLNKRLNSSGHLSFPDGLKLSSLRLSHFITLLQQAVKSVRSFVRLLVEEMESDSWDVDSAAASIQPGVSFWKPNHVCFAFESFICREMFDRFDSPNFSEENEPSTSAEKEDRRRTFFDRFTELRSARAADYLSWKPNSAFAKFCRAKYLRAVHPKMEASFFGNLDHRNWVSSGKVAETPFFATFLEMAKRVWLLHCMALAMEAEAAVFRVREKSRFSEVYMESVSDEAFNVIAEPVVAFTVVPGFRVGGVVVQAQVYLN